MKGVEIICTSLFRIGRTQWDVINRLHDLQEHSIHIRTLDGLVNTQAMGKMTRDRVIESIEHRRAPGQSIGGRPKTNKAKGGLVLRLTEEGCSYRSIRKQTELALSTIRRIIAEQEAV